MPVAHARDCDTADRPPASNVVVAVLSAAIVNEDLAARIQGFFTDRLASEAQVFERAKARGEFHPGAHPMLFMDMIAGAIWTRAALRQLPLDAGFPHQVVNAVLRGMHPAQ